MKLDWNTLIGSRLIRDQRLAPQLENGIVALINSKILNPGDRLPPIVELARDLNISHCTVEKVYKKLINKNILLSAGAQGTFVRCRNHQNTVKTEKLLARPAPYKFKKISGYLGTPGLQKLYWMDIDSEPGDINEVRNTDFINLAKAVYAAYSIEHYKQELEDTGLDNALIQLLRCRGIYINTRQFCVASSQVQLVQSALRSLLSPGDVAVMSSIYDTFHYDLLQNCSAKIRCAPPDAEGMNTRLLEKICKIANVKVVLVRPAADYPNPVSLSKARREELQQLAEIYNFVIIEIDDQHEFRYSNAQIPLIASTQTNRVIYVSTISSTLRFDFARTIVIGPEGFIKNLKKIAASRCDLHAKVNDRILAKAICENVINAHVSRFYHQYCEQRKQLCELINQTLGNKVKYLPPDSGRHLLLTFHRPVSSRVLHEIFHNNGLNIPRHECKRRPTTYKSLRISFATLKLKEMEESFRQIAQII